MTSSDSVLLDTAEGLARIRLNRPTVLNSFDEAMAARFANATRELSARSDVRAVVISGEGKGFCAGGDIGAFAADPESIAKVDGLIRNLHEGVSTLADLSVPTIAIVHGAVAGAGFSLSLGCDFVVAADNAKFTLAYSKLGATPDGGSSWMLPRLVGVRKAMEIACLSDVMSAEEALRLGLINRVAPAATALEDGLALARGLANGATQALGRAKRLIYGSYERTLSEQLDAERQSFLAVLSTADFSEGKAAFLGKRQPVFKGR